MQKQKGFALIPILITVAAIAVASFVGWRVYEASKPKPSTGSQPASSPNYLDVKELGIKIKLSDDIKDAYYVADQDGVRVATRSLVDASGGACDPKTAAPFGVLRAFTDPSLPDGRALKPNGTSVFQVGSTFIVHDMSVSACADKPSAQTSGPGQLQSFKEALKTMQPDGAAK